MCNGKYRTSLAASRICLKGLLAMYVPMIINQMIENKAMAYKAQ